MSEWNRKKINVIFYGRVPGERAASLFAVKNCDSFSKAGYETTLIVPRQLKRGRTDPYEYYGVDRRFSIKYLPTLDLTWLPFMKWFNFLVSYIFFSVVACVYLRLRRESGDIVYSNEPLPLLLAPSRGGRFLEMHDFPGRSPWSRAAIRKADGIIVTNRWKAQELEKRFPDVGEKIHYAPNAVSLSDFGIYTDLSEARHKLGLPAQSRLAGYIGSLRTMGMGKGLKEAVGAISSLSNEWKLLVVGGDIDDLRYLKKLIKDMKAEERVISVGHVMHPFIPIYSAACDVLVAPFPQNTHYSRIMSPMKVFEYMACGRPAVVSDVPAIREILSEEEAFFFKPGDSSSLAEAIVAGAGPLGRTKTEKARKRVLSYGWDDRAAGVSSFISAMTSRARKRGGVN